MDGPFTRSWLGIGYLILISGVLFGTICFTSIPLIDHDEGRHASIAQEMVERGDWITPSLQGISFYDKPVLFFWMQAASLRAFGMETWAVRIPGLLCALTACVATGLLGWRLFGDVTGLLASLFQATMLFPLATAQAAVHDVALTPCVVLALYCLWGAEQSETPRWKFLIGAGFWLGLGILTKGLMGVAFVLLAWGTWQILWRSITPNILSHFAARVMTVVTVAIMIAFPWYLAMSLRHPNYLYYYVVERHLLGFTTETQRHGDRPFWYYFPFLLAGGMPWIAYLPVSLREGLSTWRNAPTVIAPTITVDRVAARARTSAEWLVWGWLLSNLLFLTVARSKLPSYLIPIFPAVAILAGETWSRLLSGELSLPSRRLLGGIFWTTSLLSPLLLPVALFSVQQFLVSQGTDGPLTIRFELTPGSWSLILCVTVLGWGPLWLWRRGQLAAVLAWDVAVIGAHLVLILTLVFPAFADQLSARELSTYLNRTSAGPLEVRLLEERVGSVVFYLSPNLRKGLTKDQFRRVNITEFLDELTSKAGLPPGTRVVLSEREINDAAERLVIPTEGFEQVGRFRIYDARQLQPR